MGLVGEAVLKTMKMKENEIKCYVTGKMRRNTPEEKVRQRTAKCLVEEFGYKKEEIEMAFRIQMGVQSKEADIAIFPNETDHKQNTVKIIIECKREGLPLREKIFDQLSSYISACLNCEWGLFTNGEKKIAFGRRKKGANSFLMNMKISRKKMVP